MGRKPSDTANPKKVILSFCIEPDLANKIKEKCKENGIGLSLLLQAYFTKWVEKENHGR